MSSSDSLNTNDYLPSIILETMKLFAKHGDRGIRSDMLLFSVTMGEKIVVPPFRSGTSEVVYEINDRCVKAFVVLSQVLESKLQSGDHTCPRLRPDPRSLVNHLLTLVDFNIDFRGASPGATTTLETTNDRLGVGRCPPELHLIFRATDATCSCLNEPGTDSQASIDRSIWYYNDPDADNIIAKIIARDELQNTNPESVNARLCTYQEPISEPEPPPRKKPRMLIINFEENNNYVRPRIPNDASSLESFEDSTSSPFTDDRVQRATSSGSIQSHVSETPPYAIPRLVFRETSRTSLESQSSFGTHSCERQLSQGFANGSFSDYGTPNSSGSEFGGPILLQCINEAKREVAARERAIPRLVFCETPRTSLESQSSVDTHSCERQLSQGFANGSFSDYGTPNSSGSEFGGPILLQCINEAKREMAARERAQMCSKTGIVIDETDPEDYEDLSQSF